MKKRKPKGDERKSFNDERELSESEPSAIRTENTKLLILRELSTFLFQTFRHVGQVIFSRITVNLKVAQLQDGQEDQDTPA